MQPIATSFSIAAMTLALGACATGMVDDTADPWEGFNRQMYGFNEGLDRTVLEPAARGYRAVTNEPVRQGVSNFVGNLGEPVVFANQVLQGKIPGAAETFGRFVVNSTVGIVGIFDPATPMGLDEANEDFGQTLGYWGMASGPYLVLPIIGPSSPRDAFGLGVDVAANPLNYTEFDGDTEFRIGTSVLGGLSAREDALETVDDVRDTRLDPYTTLRRFHVRNRAAQIGNREFVPNEIQEVPDYELDF